MATISVIGVLAATTAGMWDARCDVCLRRVSPAACTERPGPDSAVAFSVAGSRAVGDFCEAWTRRSFHSLFFRAFPSKALLFGFLLPPSFLSICFTFTHPTPAKCVARQTRCTFVKFHRQMAPIGLGHPSAVTSLSSLSHSTSSRGLPPHAPLPHTTQLSLGVGGIGGGVGVGGEGVQPTFLYVQQAASGGEFYGQTQPAFSANEPGARVGVRSSHHPDEHEHGAGSLFAHHPGGGGPNAGSPTSAYADGDGYERRERDGAFFLLALFHN
jgi:hypothetical protein